MRKAVLAILLLFTTMPIVLAQKVEFNASGLSINGTGISRNSTQQQVRTALGAPERTEDSHRMIWYYDSKGIAVHFSKSVGILLNVTVYLETPSAVNAAKDAFTGELRYFGLQLLNNTALDQVLAIVKGVEKRDNWNYGIPVAKGSPDANLQFNGAHDKLRTIWVTLNTEPTREEEDY